MYIIIDKEKTAIEARIPPLPDSYEEFQKVYDAVYLREIISRFIL